eukprot:gene21459-28431_t
MTIPPSARLHIDYQGAISKRDDRVASATAGGSADSVSEVGQMAASLLSASSAMTNEEINVKLGELITRMDEMGTLLTTRMDEMDTKLTTRMDDLTLRMGKEEGCIWKPEDGGMVLEPDSNKTGFKHYITLVCTLEGLQVAVDWSLGQFENMDLPDMTYSGRNITDALLPFSAARRTLT